MLLVAICLVSCSSVQPQVSISGIPTATQLAPTSSVLTEQAKLTTDFNTSAAKLGLDYKCTPVCLQQVDVNVTRADQVNNWLNSVFTADSTKAEYLSVDKEIGAISFGTLNLVIVSNKTETTARAYSVSTPFNFNSSGVRILAPEWSPQALIEKYGKPNQISYTVEKISYRSFLLLDYKTWAIQYFLVGVQGAEGVASLRCEIRSGIIWTFSASEKSAMDMLKDIQQYPDSNLALPTTPPFIFAKIKTVTDTTEFSRQVEALKSTNCLAAGS